LGERALAGRSDARRAAGQNTHRLSVEWSRIEPQPGTWDEAALQHYRTMLQGILRLGLKPFVTLHHFTDPIWIYEKGGWENEETVEYFARYVEKTVAALGDLAICGSPSTNPPCTSSAAI
jgi:beta-glucosidase